jgi:thiol-disulfide isomerase/thioredoxin
MAVTTLNDPEFAAKIAAPGTVVVKYFADWCGSCKLFAPKFRRISEESGMEGVSFVEVNAETSPEARKAAGVSNLPFVAVFKDGALVEGAATNKEDLVKEFISKAN